MSAVLPGQDRAMRCSEWSRLAGLNPIGTIGSYSGLLLVECPLPWPADVAEAGPLLGLGDLLAGTGVRLQALVAPGAWRRRGAARHSASRVSRHDGGAPSDSVHGGARVALWRRRDPVKFAGYELSETEVAPGASLLEAASALLAGGGGAGASGSKPGGPLPAPASAGEVLVCTHGRRDVCCGKLGTGLVQRLGRSGAVEDQGRTLWQTSHTGGHRFAPNVILLPEGTAWGYADEELVETLLCRRGSLEDLLGHYRGCAGIGSRHLQALERAVLGVVGWAMFDWPRWGEELDGGRVRLCVETPGGLLRCWEAEVVPARRVPAPSCGTQASTATKYDVELEVRRLRETSSHG